MNYILLYKRIILIACGILIWSSVFHIVLFDQSLFHILFLGCSVSIVLSVFLIDKRATIIENPTKILQKSVEDEMEHVHDIYAGKQKELFGDSLEQLPNTKDITILSLYILQSIAKELDLVLGIYYQYTPKPDLRAIASYAFPDEYELPLFEIGEGIVGQVAKDMNSQELTDIPADYPEVVSGLGQSPPRYILFIPLGYAGHCIGVLELGFFKTLQFQEIESLHIFIERIIAQMHD